MAHRAAVLVFLFAAGCRQPSRALDTAAVPLGPAAIVSADEARFVFPASDSLEPCHYGRAADSTVRLFSWTVNIGGQGQPDWYTVDVWPAVPDSLVRRGPLELGTVLRFAHPLVTRAGGEPPLMMDVVDSVGVQAHAVEQQVMVVLSSSRTLERVFRRRPRTVLLVACHDGEDTWNREVTVQYTR
jgi:hypothetical protein